MKLLKQIFTLFILTFLFSCVTSTVSESLNNNLQFKKSRDNFEKNLKKEFDFKNMSTGTSKTTNYFGTTEEGVKLIFEKSKLNTFSDSLLYSYAYKIKTLAKTDLLNIDTFNFINVEFEDEKINEDITKKTSIIIKVQLK